MLEPATGEVLATVGVANAEDLGKSAELARAARARKEKYRAKRFLREWLTSSHSARPSSREGQQPRHHGRADRRMALAGALLGRSDRHEHLRGERQTNLREVHGFSISLRRAAALGRITTTTKTNGSISSKAGIVFYGNWTDMLPCDCV